MIAVGIWGTKDLNPWRVSEAGGGSGQGLKEEGEHEFKFVKINAGKDTKEIL